MAALTQQQWYEKIKNWVPTWVFSDPGLQVGVFNAIAKVLASADAEMRTQVDETFISRAVGLVLDQHGSERGITRNPGEEDLPYSNRIRTLNITISPGQLEPLINSILLTGVCVFLEHDYDGIFCDRDTFLNRQYVFSDINYNTFSVVVPYQGATAEAEDALLSIARLVNQSKALGTLYRLVETNA